MRRRWKALATFCSVPEGQVFCLGAATYLWVAAMLLLPPLFAPALEPFLYMFIQLAIIPLGIGTIVVAVVAVFKRRWQALVSLAILAVLWLPMKALPSVENQLWVRHFAKTENLRYGFVAFMKEQKADHDESIELPQSLTELSDLDYAYLTADDEGNRYFSYSVFTASIDNHVGFCWSESGRAPGRRAFPEIVRSKSLGGGWFIFWST